MKLSDELSELMVNHLKYLKENGLYDSSGKYIATIDDWSRPDIQEYMDKIDRQIKRLKKLMLRRDKLKRILNENINV